MNWDTSIPGKVGYIAGLLYNQNNVTPEGGPVTTLMELEVNIFFILRFSTFINLFQEDLVLHKQLESNTYIRQLN